MANKVLFCASSFSHIINFHLPYINFFISQGWEVHIAASGKPTNLNATINYNINFKKSIFSFSNISAGLRLSKIIKKEQYNLIITNSPLAGFFTRFFGPKSRKAKYVHISHGYFFTADCRGMKQKLYRICEQLCSRKTSLLLVMNDSDEQAAKKYKLCSNIAKIPGMGVDTKKFDIASSRKLDIRKSLCLPSEAFIFIYPAEFSKRKSQKYLISVIAKSVEKNNNLLFILPGDGTYIDDCKKYVVNNGLQKHVIFPGYVTDIEQFYYASDCSVSSSISEGLPFNIMEAMACGLPVVCTEVRGHTDLIDHGKGGLLVPLDDTETFASAIVQIASRPELCREFGIYNSKKIIEYNLSEVYPLITALYQKEMVT